MNGFEDELRKRILGVIPHIVLEKKGDSLAQKIQLRKLHLTLALAQHQHFFQKRRY